MDDVEKIKQWSEIVDPYEALAEIAENEHLLGYDPYYADLRLALIDMAERVSALRRLKQAEG